MKNNINNRNSILQRFCIGCALTIIHLLSYGQQTEETKFSSFETDTTPSEYRLYSLTVKCMEQKAYAMWVVVEPDENALYVLEVSSDSINYKTIYVKRGFKSPHNIKLMYSFIDENPLPNTSYYRLKRLTPDGSDISEIVILNNNQSVLSVSTSISLAK
jgi:hypothetical protein